MQRAGVKNHLVVALDNETQAQVQKFGSPTVRVNLDGEDEQQALQTGSSHAVSGVPMWMPTAQVPCLVLQPLLKQLRAFKGAVNVSVSIVSHGLHTAPVVESAGHSGPTCSPV